MNYPHPRLNLGYAMAAIGLLRWVAFGLLGCGDASDDEDVAEDAFIVSTPDFAPWP